MQKKRQQVTRHRQEGTKKKSFHFCATFIENIILNDSFRSNKAGRREALATSLVCNCRFWCISCTRWSARVKSMRCKEISSSAHMEYSSDEKKEEFVGRKQTQKKVSLIFYCTSSLATDDNSCWLRSACRRKSFEKIFSFFFDPTTSWKLPHHWKADEFIQICHPSSKTCQRSWRERTKMWRRGNQSNIEFRWGNLIRFDLFLTRSWLDDVKIFYKSLDAPEKNCNSSTHPIISNLHIILIPFVFVIFQLFLIFFVTTRKKVIFQSRWAEYKKMQFNSGTISARLTNNIFHSIFFFFLIWKNLLHTFWIFNDFFHLLTILQLIKFLISSSKSTQKKCVYFS